MTGIPELNDLVREAFGAQEAFDNWDAGRTYGGGAFWQQRECTLDEITREWDEANLKLIAFVVTNQISLLAALDTSIKPDTTD